MLLGKEKSALRELTEREGERWEENGNRKKQGEQEGSGGGEGVERRKEKERREQEGRREVGRGGKDKEQLAEAGVVGKAFTMNNARESFPPCPRRQQTCCVHRNSPRVYVNRPPVCG